jgi:hypothetical protein
MAVLFTFIGSDGCRRERPNNIPTDSVYVEGGKACWWQRCSYDPNQDSDHCQIFNMGGDIIYDEVFLPYDGEKAPKANELEIDGFSIPRGPDYVHLKNGRILIPKSQFEQQRQFLDSLTHINVVRHK